MPVYTHPAVVELVEDLISMVKDGRVERFDCDSRLYNVASLDGISDYGGRFMSKREVLLILEKCRRDDFMEQGMFEMFKKAVKEYIVKRAVSEGLNADSKKRFLLLMEQ